MSDADRIANGADLIVKLAALGADPSGLSAAGTAANAAALRVRTEADHPLSWAATQINLGNVLQEQGRPLDGAAGAAKLGEAAAAYHAALRVWTEAKHPLAWALTQYNFARLEEARAVRADCAGPRGALQAALRHAEEALRVYDPEHRPKQHAETVALRDRVAARLADLDEE